MSPQNTIQKKFENRRYKSPSRLIEKQLEKQKTAEKNREAIENQRSEKLNMITQKIEEINIKKNKELIEHEKRIQTKLESADNRYERHIQSIVEKARIENTKVPESGEIEFLNKVIRDTKKAAYYNKLEESEERRQKILNDKINKAKLGSEKEYYNIFLVNLFLQLLKDHK